MNENEKYIRLLRETDKHIEDELYGSAIRSASLGMELLLQDLVAQLCADMEDVDRSRARDLKRDWHELKQDNKNKLSFGLLTKVYSNKNIFGQLTEICGFEFSQFTIATLNSTQNLRNEVSHTADPQNKTNAEIIRNRFTRFLVETARLPEGWDPGQENKEDETAIEKSPIENLASDWSDKWSQLIGEWLNQTDKLQDKVLVSSLLDFLMLVTGLISDKRISADYRPQLLLAVNYVVLTADLIPEHDDNVRALRDDAAVLTLTLHWLLHNSEISEEILRDHWVQSDDPVAAIHYMAQYIRTSHHSLFNDEEWEAIHLIADHGPEALWNNSGLGHFPEKEALDNVYQLIGEIEGTTEWENTWRPRIIDWVKSSSSSNIADLVMLVPDLLVLVKRLLGDSRVAAEAKPRLLAAVTYVITPLDLIPEALVGVVGLTDDVGALVLVSLWLTRSFQIDEKIIHEHWTRTSKPMNVLRNLHNILLNTESVFGHQSGVWIQLLERFSVDVGNELTLVQRVRRLLRRSSS